MSVTIRQATPEDIPGIQQLFRQLDGLHRDLFPEILTEESAADPRTDAQLTAFIEGSTSDYLVAIKDSAVVGFFSIEQASLPDSPLFRPNVFAKIDSAVVEKDHQGQGIGRLLFEAAVAWAGQRGLSSLQATVWNDNTGAHRFYEELGFLPVTQKLEYRIEGDDASDSRSEMP